MQKSEWEEAQRRCKLCTPRFSARKSIWPRIRCSTGSRWYPLAAPGWCARCWRSSWARNTRSCCFCTRRLIPRCCTSSSKGRTLPSCSSFGSRFPSWTRRSNNRQSELWNETQIKVRFFFIFFIKCCVFYVWCKQIFIFIDLLSI